MSDFRSSVVQATFCMFRFWSGAISEFLRLCACTVVSSAKEPVCYQAHQTKSEDTWKKFRDVRNLLRTKIKQAKRSFYQKALSSNSRKELWRTTHRILNPSSKPIPTDADELNRHFSNTTRRLLELNHPQ